MEETNPMWKCLTLKQKIHSKQSSRGSLLHLWLFHPLKKLLGLYAPSSLCAGSLCPIIGVHIYKLFSQFKMKIKRKIRPLCHFYFGELLLLLFSYKIHGVVLAYDYLSCLHSDSCYERSWKLEWKLQQWLDFPRGRKVRQRDQESMLSILLASDLKLF